MGSIYFNVVKLFEQCICFPWSHVISKHIWVAIFDWRKKPQIIFLLPLWCTRLCCANECLDLKVFLQKLQEMENPSKCRVSMWLFMWALIASFPHTLHLYSGFPFGIFLKVFSIISSNWDALPSSLISPSWFNVIRTPSKSLLLICSPMFGIEGTFVPFLWLGQLFKW